jgi:glutamine synthetase
MRHHPARVARVVEKKSRLYSPSRQGKQVAAERRSCGPEADCYLTLAEALSRPLRPLSAEVAKGSLR